MVWYILLLISGLMAKVYSRACKGKLPLSFFELSKCKFILSSSLFKDSFAFVQYHRDFLFEKLNFFCYFLLWTSICDESLFQFKKICCCTGEVVFESLESSCQCFDCFQFFLFLFFLSIIYLFAFCFVLFLYFCF